MKKLMLIGILCGLNLGFSKAVEFQDDSVFLELFSNAVKILLFIFVVLIVFQFLHRLAVKSVGSKKSNAESDFAEEIKNVISDFEEEDFLAWVAERFVKFQKSWSKGSIEELHPFETESLYEMHKMQMEELRQKKLRNVIEGISIKETDIVSFADKKETYEVVVHIRANMRNYFIDYTEPAEEQTISEAFNYYLTFEKQKQSGTLTTCPVCTAPVSPNATHCEYCRSAFPKALDHWLLAKIDMV